MSTPPHFLDMAEAAGSSCMQEASCQRLAGRLEEPVSLDRALTGADALFAVTTPFEGVAAEAHKGIALVDAAGRAGISHLVYTSACHADQSTGIPSFESKLRVEQHVRASGVPFTIVAPVYFMENLLTPFSLSRLHEGQYARWMPLERTLQQIAVEDIGRFCTWVFEHREDFLGRRIDIAGDELDLRLPQVTAFKKTSVSPSTASWASTTRPLCLPGFVPV